MSSSDRLGPQDILRLGLHDILKELGLTRAAAELEPASKKAIARQDPPTALLDHLMREELRSRLETRAQWAIKRAHIFPQTSLDTYDFNFPTKIDREAVDKAATLDFIRTKTNVVFVGPSGVGKTHLSNAIGHLAAAHGYRVRFVLAADLVNDLVARQARNTLHRGLAAWSTYDLLIVDELGYLSFDSRGADLLYQVFNKRYQRAATMVTTNLPFKEWGKLFHSALAAGAIAERLVHNGILVRIAGKSARTTPVGSDPT